MGIIKCRFAHLKWNDAETCYDDYYHHHLSGCFGWVYIAVANSCHCVKIVHNYIHSSQYYLRVRTRDNNKVESLKPSKHTIARVTKSLRISKRDREYDASSQQEKHGE